LDPELEEEEEEEHQQQRQEQEGAQYDDQQEEEAQTEREHGQHEQQEEEDPFKFFAHFADTLRENLPSELFNMEKTSKLAAKIDKKIRKLALEAPETMKNGFEEAEQFLTEKWEEIRQSDQVEEIKTLGEELILSLKDLKSGLKLENVWEEVKKRWSERESRKDKGKKREKRRKKREKRRKKREEEECLEMLKSGKVESDNENEDNEKSNNKRSWSRKSGKSWTDQPLKYDKNESLSPEWLFQRAEGREKDRFEANRSDWWFERTRKRQEKAENDDGYELDYDDDVFKTLHEFHRRMVFPGGKRVIPEDHYKQKRGCYRQRRHFDEDGDDDDNYNWEWKKRRFSHQEDHFQEKKRPFPGRFPHQRVFRHKFR